MTRKKYAFNLTHTERRGVTRSIKTIKRCARVYNGQRRRVLNSLGNSVSHIIYVFDEFRRCAFSKTRSLVVFIWCRYFENPTRSSAPVFSNCFRGNKSVKSFFDFLKNAQSTKISLCHCKNYTDGVIRWIRRDSLNRNVRFFLTFHHTLHVVRNVAGVNNE